MSDIIPSPRIFARLTRTCLFIVMCVLNSGNVFASGDNNADVFLLECPLGFEDVCIFAHHAQYASVYSSEPTRSADTETISALIYSSVREAYAEHIGNPDSVVPEEHLLYARQADLCPHFIRDTCAFVHGAVAGGTYRNMQAFGPSASDISHISLPTLFKHYREEVDKYARLIEKSDDDCAEKNWMKELSFSVDDTTRIAFIRIPLFDCIPHGKFMEVARNVKNSGVERYILDLRNNPGGNVYTMLYILTLFVGPNQHVATFLYPHAQFKEVTDVYPKKTVPDGLKGIIIVDHLTGSAAEVFAAALRKAQSNSVKIIGIPTYKKNVFQSDFAGKKVTFSLTTGKVISAEGEYGISGVVPNYWILNVSFLTDAEILQHATNVFSAW